MISMKLGSRGPISQRSSHATAVSTCLARTKTRQKRSIRANPPG